MISCFHIHTLYFAVACVFHLYMILWYWAACTHLILQICKVSQIFSTSEIHITSQWTQTQPKITTILNAPRHLVPQHPLSAEYVNCWLWDQISEQQRSSPPPEWVGRFMESMHLGYVAARDLSAGAAASSRVGGRSWPWRQPWKKWLPLAMAKWRVYMVIL